MSRRTKILLRLTAFLSLVRWIHILFLAVAQGLAAFTLLRNGAPIQWATLAGVILSTAGIVAGGSLFNSFYDLERDLIERPWRTLLERPVAKKYGMKLAFSFYGIAGLVAFATLKWTVAASILAYGLIVFLYSHKRWGFGVGGALVASLLAFAPLLLVTAALLPDSLNGFIRGLPLALAMIGLEWRRQWERRQIPTAPPVTQRTLVRQQWIYKLVLALSLGFIPLI